MIDDRKWHIYKDANTPTRPWHIELTENGQHCHSPNEPVFRTYTEAVGFVSRHVTAHARRREQQLAKLCAVLDGARYSTVCDTIP